MNVSLIEASSKAIGIPIDLRVGVADKAETTLTREAGVGGNTAVRTL